MPTELPLDLLELAELQHGVISRKQAIGSGLAPKAVDKLVRAGHWLSVQRGVYSIRGGEQGRKAMLWAVTLRAGRLAVLSYQTAAELHGLYDEPSRLIHVSVPEPRHIVAMQGVVVHRSSHVEAAAQLNLSPPRTRIEDTVLDLAHQSATFEAAFAIAASACQRRLTTSARLTEAMSHRSKMRWRSELAHPLGEIGSGAHSLLEYRHVRRVEQPHALPTATRQAKIVIDDHTFYLDNLYRGYRVCVELDGRQAHPDDRRWLETRRDNALAAVGLTTLRYGWADVTERPCLAAAEIGAALRDHGWQGSVRSCGPGCAAVTRGETTGGHQRLF